MTARNPCLDAALVELAATGIRDPAVARGTKHWQVRWANPRGEVRMVTVAGTASDWRAVENARRDVRRILRADGMLAAEPRPVPTRQPSQIELLERRLAKVERQLRSLIGDRQATT
jgi:hypothetical protein